MPNFHLILADGTERDIKADEAVAEYGVLVLRNIAGVMVALYGAGQWVLCEPERRDDHG